MRLATFADIPTLQRIGLAAIQASEGNHMSAAYLQASREAYWSNEAMAALMGDPDLRTWVAEVEGEVRGFAMTGTLEPSRRALLRLYVHPDWQRRGIGSGLWRHVLTAEPAPPEGWTVGAVVGNHEARKLYESWGFRHYGNITLALGAATIEVELLAWPPRGG